MSATEVGPHDPVLLKWSDGYWTECECGWIGPSVYQEATALRAHERHVKQVQS